MLQAPVVLNTPWVAIIPAIQYCLRGCLVLLIILSKLFGAHGPWGSAAVPMLLLIP